MQNHDRKTQVARQAIVDRLAAPVMLEGLSLAGMRAIMGFRILSICSRAGRDPVVELTRRFRSVCAARAFIALADKVGQCWPENVLVYRPCAPVLSPDEQTLAQLVERAANRDRAGFGHLLDGFVRESRHCALFSAAVLAVAEADLTRH